MNHWQEWAVGVLVFLCIVRIVRSVILFFRRTEKKENPCDSCVSGCELKNIKKKKPVNCPQKEESKKKKCCG